MCIRDSYYIDKYEVTNAQYGKFMQATGHKKPKYWDDSKYNQTNQPVVGVNWHDAAAFAKWAGKRLPTEAEWEKAAGGEDGRKYPWGDGWDGRLLNFADNNSDELSGEYLDEKGKKNTWTITWAVKSVDDGYGYTAPVGSYEEGKSPYGCYDMAGNVWEWCADWYDKNYYKNSPYRNPTGPSKGKYRALRGGSWYSNNNYVRCAYRDYDTPDNRIIIRGFRCARTP